MTIARFSVIAAVCATLALSAPAAALPRTTEAFEAQMNICKAGLDMVVDGATDDEEIAMYTSRLEQYGWTEDGDLEELVLLCAFYKQGWIYANNG